ncbi:MAG: hypothetical protein DI637_00895 [Citromicrobium sp.]|nr:MAG: hypothetical protein DI637_00895 [Citromicrobium sp.]
MTRAALSDSGGRGLALAALAIPVMVGIAFQLSAGAPPSYALTNGLALVCAEALVLTLRISMDSRRARVALWLGTMLLFVPLATGPSINGIARWLPIGPVTLHAGMLTIPAIAVLSAHTGRAGIAAMLVALFAALVQPDAGSGMAICGAAIGLYVARPDWKSGSIAFLAFGASLSMFLRGELPPQRFVERILVDAAAHSVWHALAIMLAMVAAVCLLALPGDGTRSARYALAGSFAGFSIAALVSHYPYPLIGFGAAPILGYGVALAMLRPEP